MFLLKKILAALLLPPLGPLLAALFGLRLMRAKSRRWQNGGLVLATLSLLGLLLLSLPIVGEALMKPLEPYPPLAEDQLRRAQAIVILGGGSYYDAPEYGGDTVGPATLERLRYGARLARRSGLPLLVTGGAPFGGRAEAELMREALEADFGVKARWVEPASQDTEQNAAFSAPLLKAAGVGRIVLVSHGWHLPRALPLFGAQGLEAIPAPIAFSTPAPTLLARFLPGALGSSRQALNEYLGQAYNRLQSIAR